jgi:hypothetical protein
MSKNAAQKKTACRVVNLENESNEWKVSSPLEDCEAILDVEDVKKYITSLMLLVEEIKKLKLNNIDDICKVFNENFDVNVRNGWWMPNKGGGITKSSFGNKNEDNPFSFFAAMYLLNKLMKEKPEANSDQQLEAIHNGWAICRLMRLDEEGEFQFDYVTKIVDKNPPQIRFGGITDDKSSRNDIELNMLINIPPLHLGFYSLLDKGLTIELNFDDDKKTIIRGNQLCNFVPFDKLSKRIRNMDKPFLVKYLEKGEGGNPKYKICTEAFVGGEKGPQPQGQVARPPPQPQGQVARPQPQGQVARPPPQPQGQAARPQPQGQVARPPPQPQGQAARPPPPPQGNAQAAAPPASVPPWQQGEGGSGRKSKKSKSKPAKKFSSQQAPQKKQSGGCGGGMCGPVATNKRVMIGGRNKIVYSGKRGGEYVKSAGEFIPLNKLKI